MTDHKDTTRQKTDSAGLDPHDTTGENPTEENPAEENLPWPTQHPHDQHDVMRPDQGQDNS
ncbi:MAG TPA: hypothetical protein VGP05_07075 [Pseudonocardia sp.]|jgi:hypothetical protein|nr:hypothetical protein [Pseudonocardia sp.]